MSAKRAIFSITSTVLDDFNRSVPIRDRSKIVESFMRKHVQSQEAQLEAAAKAIEADADYNDIMQDAAALTNETALRLPPHD
jgi:hypothetical protein